MTLEIKKVIKVGLKDIGDKTGMTTPKTHIGLVFLTPYSWVTLTDCSPNNQSKNRAEMTFGIKSLQPSSHVLTDLMKSSTHWSDLGVAERPS